MGQRTNHDLPSLAVTGDERRTGRRLDASALGPVVARLIGGSEVRLIDFSQRGVLVESDTRLLIGARATVKITTTDAVVTVGGYVVRSRVAGVKNGALVYHTALALNDDLTQLEQAAKRREDARKPPPSDDSAYADDDSAHDDVEARASADPTPALLHGSESAYSAASVTGRPFGPDATAGDPVLEFLATVPHDLAELRRRAAVNNWTSPGLDP